ncbi:hypothetical protein [Gymnodinialimonas ulvae]|uniref:hypothetical protein n=1 Tax=Gymnodinialimonas ulvae TaxID=3126504 RepID=UPI0030B19670
MTIYTQQRSEIAMAGKSGVRIEITRVVKLATLLGQLREIMLICGRSGMARRGNCP